MNEKLTSGLTDEKAQALLHEHNKEAFHLTHATTVSGVMRELAREFDPEHEAFWAQVGLLHDIDYENHPAEHCVACVPILEEAGATPEFIHAVTSHGAGLTQSQAKPELMMEKVLFAVDELTGLIGAAVLMRPSKSVSDFTSKSLKKKFKDKSFAAGCNRDVIVQGAEALGWDLNELFDRTIAAMQAVEAREQA